MRGYCERHLQAYLAVVPPASPLDLVEHLLVLCLVDADLMSRVVAGWVPVRDETLERHDHGIGCPSVEESVKAILIQNDAGAACRRRVCARALSASKSLLYRRTAIDCLRENLGGLDLSDHWVVVSFLLLDRLEYERLGVVLCPPSP